MSSTELIGSRQTNGPHDPPCGPLAHLPVPAALVLSQAAWFAGPGLRLRSQGRHERPRPGVSLCLRFKTMPADFALDFHDPRTVTSDENGPHPAAAGGPIFTLGRFRAGVDDF
jgi:hypothetical protein